MTQTPATSVYVRGVLYGLTAVSMWAFIVVARLGIRTNMTPWDIAAIRFTVSGSLLLPHVFRRGFALERLGRTGLVAVVAGCGAPMVLLANGGLLFAPAAHGGALFPGVTPLMVAILAAVVLREAFTLQKRIGCTLIVIGAIGIAWGASGTIGTRQNIGHLLFLSAGFMWACYTVAMRRARSTAFTPPVLQPLRRFRSICRSMHLLPDRAFSGLRCPRLLCKRSCRGC